MEVSQLDYSYALNSLHPGRSAARPPAGVFVLCSCIVRNWSRVMQDGVDRSLHSKIYSRIRLERDLCVKHDTACMHRIYTRECMIASYITWRPGQWITLMQLAQATEARRVGVYTSSPQACAGSGASRTSSSRRRRHRIAAARHGANRKFKGLIID